MINNRTFYLFDINDNFVNLYKNNPTVVYEMLEQISKVDKNDYKFAFKLLSEIVKKIDKFYLNNLLISSRLLKLTAIDTYALIDNKYNEEILNITNLHLKINTTKVNSELFNVLLKYSNNFLVCDFKNKDYFWLNKIY